MGRSCHRRYCAVMTAIAVVTAVVVVAVAAVAALDRIESTSGWKEGETEPPSPSQQQSQPQQFALILSFGTKSFWGTESWRRTSFPATASSSSSSSSSQYRRRHRKLDFGDYAEHPDSCPARTTCPVVCAANATYCPKTGNDSGNDDIGSNVTDLFPIDDVLCPCPTLPIVCPRVIDFYDTCQERFQLQYDANAECLAIGSTEQSTVDLISFTGPWFVAMYLYFAILAVAVVLWCYVNQIGAPVANSTLPLQARGGAVVVASTAGADGYIDATNGILNTTTCWTQTGYKINVLGSILDALVGLSFVLIQFLLLVTTLWYYMQQGGITRWKVVVEDEVQVLQVFILVWMVGFFWCFAFRYPSTGVQSLFLRRCILREANFVAVVAPIQSAATVADKTDWPRLVARRLWTPIDAVFRTLFSYPYDRPGDDTETVFCVVHVDTHTGTRSFVHRMRRYVLDGSNQVDDELELGRDNDASNDASNEAPSAKEASRRLPSTTTGFVPCALTVGITFGDLIQQVGGLSSDEAVERLGRQGPNVIPLEKPTLIGSLQKEFAKSFYLYQNFCVWVFANLWYYQMACIFTFYRIVGACLVVYFQHKSESLLYHLSHVEGTVEVLRDGVYSEIPVVEVVPGDVVVLKPGIVGCDLVVLKGFRVLVDESALTGEATPQLKTKFDRGMWHIPYHAAQHQMYTLSAGTEIIELNEDGDKALGLVMTTGSFTAKGELLTDVLSYPRQSTRNDEVKVILFILLLEVLVLIALVFFWLPDHWVYSWFYGLYILASVFPILLPTVFVVSMCVSAGRLQTKRISCLYPESLLLAGKVDAAFFDKTGTVTQSGMDFVSFNGYASSDRIRLGMAVCHTLTTTSSGEVVGNQVDLASFQSTGAILRHEKGAQALVSFNGEQYTVLKRFEFDSRRATQSVIVEDSQRKRQIFVKGSPEVIKDLCMEPSLPPSFEQTVQEAAGAGIYQIAMAYRSYHLEMELADVCREDVEGCLTFGGFINFRNPIRPEALHVLETVQESKMALAMITGDNVFTGIFVARECNMIKPHRSIVVGRLSANEEVLWYNMDANAVVKRPSPFLLSLPENQIDLAITGEAWNVLTRTNPVYVKSIMEHIRVFGRCKPTDKVSVVAAFVSSGYTTLMCGDGQNDCGCLKAAHVGVALSNAEASIVAPFTSLDKSLSAVLDVLREGRCAVASTVSAYSFYLLYGQTEAFLQVTMAYLAISLSEWCWVFLDGIFSITLAFSIPLAQAASVLTSRRPNDHLLGQELLFSVCGTLAWNLFYLALAMLILFRQDWFQCRKWDSTDVSNILDIGDNYESTVLFLMGGYQFVVSAFVLNFGYTFRQAWYRNVAFVFLASTWALFIFVMTLYPSTFSCIWRVNCDNENVVRWLTSPVKTPINNPFNTTVMPVSFRLILVTLMVANLATIIVWQVYFVNGYLVNRTEKGPTEKRTQTASME